MLPFFISTGPSGSGPFHQTSPPSGPMSMRAVSEGSVRKARRAKLPDSRSLLPTFWYRPLIDDSIYRASFLKKSGELRIEKHGDANTQEPGARGWQKARNQARGREFLLPSEVFNKHLKRLERAKGFEDETGGVVQSVLQVRER